MPDPRALSLSVFQTKAKLGIPHTRSAAHALTALWQGHAPAKEDILAVRHMLLLSQELRVLNLEKQLGQQSDLSPDASKSLISLLQNNLGATKQLAAGLDAPTAEYRSACCSCSPAGVDLVGSDDKHFTMASHSAQTTTPAVALR